jgi:hypothetical protein
MLALSRPQHRALVPAADVIGIGGWEKRYIDDEHGWVRRHRYSGVEQPADPPAPPAYQTPSPGNPAAVGIHIEPIIDPNGDFDLGNWDEFLHPIGAAEGPTNSDLPTTGRQRCLEILDRLWRNGICR